LRLAGIAEDKFLAVSGNGENDRKKLSWLKVDVNCGPTQTIFWLRWRLTRINGRAAAASAR